MYLEEQVLKSSNLGLLQIIGFVALIQLKNRSTARYVGALVADVHNILINGGIYAYPSTRQAPDGKLRLLYESAPMAMIMEQAGGAGSTGKGRILDVRPTKIHQRVPTFLGSLENVFELDQFFQYYEDNIDAATPGEFEDDGADVEADSD